MFCFSVRRKGRRGDSPEPRDRRSVPERRPGAAGPRQPQPEAFSRMAGNGIRPSRGSQRDTGIPGEEGDGPGRAQADGREPGSCRNAGARQEKPEVEKRTPSRIQPLGKGPGAGPGAPRPAQNGNVPREGTEQPRAPLQAGGGEDEEGEPGGSSQDGREPGAEPREQLWEKLRQLGEAMEQWEGKPTAALAARLTRRIMETPTSSYPAEPGTRGSRWETGPDLGAPAGSDGTFVGMLRVSGNAESREEEEEENNKDKDKDEEHSHWDQNWEWEQELEKEEEEEEEEEHPYWDKDWDWEQEPEQEEDQEWEQEEEEDGEQEPAVFVLYVCQSAFSRALGEEFPEVWARSRADCGRLAQEVLLEGEPVPFQSQPRLRPAVERHMEELLREYLREGIVVEGTSDSNSPLILRKKSKGRGWRLSLDCRALNAATPVAPPERPDRAKILASIHPRSRFFSVLDLSNACLAIPLASESWPRFAFTFQGRQFLFTRLPPTFRDTNSILHRCVADMLDQLELEPGADPGVFHYYDDILITGKSWRQAESRTRRVLELIRSTGFKANPDKAQLMRRQVNYLGVTIGAMGRHVPTEKVREICRECDAPGPWDRHRLLSVLKKFESRQEFIPDYWELALPLQRLAVPGKQEREWEWEWEQQEQLQRLREALEAAPVLRFPMKSRPFLIRLRMHAETAGATLLQEKAGILLPVGHSSHRLSGRSLSPWDAWIRAAVRAVRSFQTLTGPAPIVIQDPNGNYLLRGEAFVTSSSDDSRLPQQRPQLPEPWTLLVAMRVPEPQESQRIVIPPAPPLGQLPPDIPRANVWFLGVERGSWLCSSVGFVAANLEERWMHGVTGKGSEADAELEALREILEQHRSRFPLFLYCNRPGLAARLERREREQGWNSGGTAWPRVLRWLRAFPGMLSIREVGTGGSTEPLEREWIEKVSGSAGNLGSITRSSWILWKLSQPELQEIVARCHQYRHEGVERTLARVREVESWGSDREDVARWVRSCPTCRKSHPNPNPGPGPDPGAAPQRAEGPWSCLRISLSEALPSSPEGFQALLLVQDELSGWLDAFPLQQRSQPDVSWTLLREVFGRLGKVESVLVAPAPAWLRRSLKEAPLRDFWSRLERSEPPAAATCVSRAAQAAGKGWAEALPLILAGARSRWIQVEQLRPLLCVPGLPLELFWEAPGGGNELCRLRGAPLLPGHRERVEAALRTEPGSAGSSIRGIRDLGTPDPGSEYARGAVRLRWIRDWAQAGQELDGPGSGIGMARAQAPP